MKDKIKELLLAVGGLAFVYFIFHITGIGCPIKFLTGVSCMGCGMTRSYFALAHMDVEGAFHYHPLFLLPVVAALLIIFKKKIPGNFYKICIFTIIALFIIIYIVRLLDPNDSVVVFDPKSGLIYKICGGVIKYVL